MFVLRQTNERRKIEERTCCDRGLMLTESKNVRYVPGDLVLADCLTETKVKENSLIKAIWTTNHYPTLLFVDDETVTQELMDEACEIIEIFSYPDQRNHLRIQMTDTDREKQLVNQILHGKRPEHEQKRMLHNMKFIIRTTQFNC